MHSLFVYHQCYFESLVIVNYAIFGSALGEQSKNETHFCQKHSNYLILLEKYTIP